MKLIIEIPEKVYNAVTHIEFDASLVVNEMRKSIANGTPIPDNFHEFSPSWWDSPYDPNKTDKAESEDNYDS